VAAVAAAAVAALWWRRRPQNIITLTFITLFSVVVSPTMDVPQSAYIPAPFALPPPCRRLCTRRNLTEFSRFYSIVCLYKPKMFILLIRVACLFLSSHTIHFVLVALHCRYTSTGQISILISRAFFYFSLEYYLSGAGTGGARGATGPPNILQIS
jgi:hypothetical protein